MFVICTVFAETNPLAFVFFAKERERKRERWADLARVNARGRERERWADLARVNERERERDGQTWLE